MPTEARPGGFHVEFLGLNEEIKNFDIKDGADALFRFGNSERWSKIIETVLAQKLGQ